MVKVQFLFCPSEALQQYLLENCVSPSGAAPILLVFPTKEEAKNKDFKAMAVAKILVGWQASEALLQQAKKAILFINPGAGVQQHIDLFTKIKAQGRVLTLVNGHGNAYFTAQHTVALLLALCNKLSQHDAYMRSGKWRTGDKEGASLPLKYRRIGLLGYGAVNRKVAQFLRPFTANFAILKRTWSLNEELPSSATKKFTKLQLPEFLQYIDTLIIALPLTNETKGMIGAKELQLLGKQGVLVNVARGAVVVQKALFDALEQQQIQGAAIDVWYDYKAAPNTEGKCYPYQYPFHQLNNILLSPHRAASPFSDLERWQEVCDNIIRLAQGRSDFLHIVGVERGY